MVVSWRVSALVLLGAIPLIAAPSVGFVWYWAGGCLVLGALDALTAVSPRELRVRREVDGPIRADETSASVLTITNPTKRRLRLVVRDGWPPSLRPSPARHAVRVEAGSSVVLRTRLAPTRRGTREADHATLRVWGALGLGGRQISIDAPLSLSVLPAFRARVLLPSRLARLHELEGTTPTTLRGAGTEFDSLREYVRGDDPRDIDWRASARSKEVRGADRVSVRDSEAIGALISAMGAKETFGVWQERRERREARGSANRLANFDDANLRRSARAAVAAGARVERAFEILGDDIPEHLLEAGRLRLEYKQASLEELGKHTDPPLTKDAVAGRIRRLLTMADKAAHERGIPDTEAALTLEMLEED